MPAIASLEDLSPQNFNMTGDNHVNITGIREIP
jgi:hypothetical protein